MFQEVHEKLDLILSQTTAHNGRMKSLEQWRWYLAGMGTIITILIPVLFTMNSTSVRNLEVQVLENTKIIHAFIGK